MPRYNFDKVITGLVSVMGQLGDSFPSSHREIVLELIDNREYGIALEIICAVIIHDHIYLPAACLTEIEKMADTMEMKENKKIAELLNLATGN